MKTQRSTTPRIPLLSAWILAAWSLFVWVGRVRNIIADDELVGSARLIRLVLSGSFVLLGIGVVVGLVLARRSGVLSAWGRGLISALSLYSIVTWVIRGIDITFGGDHSVGFIIVHAVLAIVSIGLSYWAIHDLRNPNYSSTTPTDARISA